MFEHFKKLNKALNTAGPSVRKWPGIIYFFWFLGTCLLISSIFVRENSFRTRFLISGLILVLLAYILGKFLIKLTKVE